MPRANRHFLPGHVWHITHRCHQKAFLLKFARDRQRYREIQAPPKRYAVIDLAALSALSGLPGVAEFQKAHRQWVEEALSGQCGARDERWSEAIAVGSRQYVDKVKTGLGSSAAHRQIAAVEGTYTLREPGTLYAHGFEVKNDLLRLNNTLPWDENAEATGA